MGKDNKTMMAYAKKRVEETKALYATLNRRKKQVLAFYSEPLGKNPDQLSWKDFFTIFSEFVENVKTSDTAIKKRSAKENKDRKAEDANKKVSAQKKLSRIYSKFTKQRVIIIKKTLALVQSINAGLDNVKI